MSSGTSIIEDALKRIGVHSVVVPASPEDITSGKDALNSMLQLWISWSIMIKVVPLDAQGDELGEPMDTRNAIVDNLALQLAPFYDNGKGIVSQELRDNARRLFNQVKDLYQKVTIPKKVVSGLLPRGAGHSAGTRARTFSGKGATLSD